MPLYNDNSHFSYCTLMGNKHSSLIDMLYRLEVFCREHGIEQPMMSLMEHVEYIGKKIVYRQ